MKSKLVSTLALAGALSLAFVPAGLSAQKPEAAAGSIVGFSSIPWGSTEAAVMARAGAPVQVAALGELKVLAYTERLLGEDVSTFYYLHPQHGLIAGSYTARYTFGNSCWEIYSKFKEAIAGRYPNLRPVVREDNESRSLDMCGAIAIGRGNAAVAWNDPVNGARAYVQIQDDPREVQTMYFSAQGIRTIDEINAGERRDRF